MTSKGKTKSVSAVHLAKADTVTIRDLKLLPVLAMRDLGMADVTSLTESIRTHGLLNPLLVRKNQKGKLELISGHRRYLALRQAGIKTAPARILQVTDHEAFVLAMTENLERTDPEPMEEAEAFKRATEEMGMKARDIAEQIGRSESYVSNRIKLTKMPKGVQTGIRKGYISPGMCEHGFFKLKHSQDHAQLLEAIKDSIDPGSYEDPMTVRDVEEMAKSLAQDRQQIEDLANYRAKNKDKIKKPKCPECKDEPNPHSSHIRLDKNVYVCENCHAWNPLTGEKRDYWTGRKKTDPKKTSQVSVLDGRPTGSPREPQTKQEAQGHRSEADLHELMDLIFEELVKKKAIRKANIHDEWGEGLQIRLHITKDKLKNFPCPIMVLEPKNYKNSDYKTSVRVGPQFGANNKEVLKAREDLWTLEKKAGIKNPAHISRVSMIRVVLERKAMSKGKELVVTSGKYLGVWKILTVHRDYTAKVKDPAGKKVLLEEKEFRALIRAAYPQKPKKTKKKKGGRK